MRRLICALILMALLPAAPTRAAEPVDLLLVLAADVSRSVDNEKFKLQRDGYAAAISDKRVLDAISAGRNHRIAVLYLEWSGLGNQKVVIDWTPIDGPKAAQEFGEQRIASRVVHQPVAGQIGEVAQALMAGVEQPQLHQLVGRHIVHQQRTGLF